MSKKTKLDLDSVQAKYDPTNDSLELNYNHTNGMDLKEVSTWDSNETTQKDVYGLGRVTMFEPTPKNMHRLMLKINELVEEINKLKQ